MVRRGLVAAAILASACWAAPASAQYIHLKDFPQLFGSYAPKGGCGHAPRVTVNLSGVRVEGAGRNTLFPGPEVALGWNGPEDNNVVLLLRGPDHGLILSFARDGSEAVGLSGRAAYAGGARDRFGHAQRVAVPLPGRGVGCAAAATARAGSAEDARGGRDECRQAGQ
jgi:hypothetical protein